MAVRISRGELMSQLQYNVIEATFTRRIPLANRPSSRRALITNCTSLLNSALGREVLHFRPPIGYGLPYSLEQYQLVGAWDIFWQDYRQFDGLTASLVTAIPVRTPEEQVAWWEYFRLHIAVMSPSERMVFMDS